MTRCRNSDCEPGWYILCWQP